MALAAKNAKQKKIAVTRGRAAQKTTRSSPKGRDTAPTATKSAAKQATRKQGRPPKMSAADTRADAVLSAQLEAIGHELSSLAALRDEIRDLRDGIEALTDRMDSLAESVRAGTREHPDGSERPQEPDDPAETWPPGDET